MIPFMAVKLHCYFFMQLFCFSVTAFFRTNTYHLLIAVDSTLFLLFLLWKQKTLKSILFRYMTLVSFFICTFRLIHFNNMIVFSVTLLVRFFVFLAFNYDFSTSELCTSGEPLRFLLSLFPIALPY